MGLLATVAATVVGFRLRHQEQSVLIEKEKLSRECADAEVRYRILAENAVDVVIHFRRAEVVWASPSIEAALGVTARRWIGSDFNSSVHPEDKGPWVYAPGAVFADLAAAVGRRGGLHRRSRATLRGLRARVRGQSLHDDHVAAGR